MSKGKGQGWHGESKRHMMSRYGYKTVLPDGRRLHMGDFVAGGKVKDIDISRRYWSMKIEDGKMKLSLGNLTDAGWYWSGDETELSGYLVRIQKSKITEEFISDMEDEEIIFEDLKPLILESLEDKEGNGLYQITGDNIIWHFGQGYDLDIDMELEYYDQEYDLTKKDMDEIKDKYWSKMSGKSINFDEFKESNYYDDIKLDIKEAIIESNTFQEYFKSLGKIDETAMYSVSEWSDEIEREEFSEAFHSWKSEKQKDGRKFKGLN